MKRVILFRGLRTDGKGWICGNLVIILDKFYWIKINEIECQVVPKTVGQFTGLTDKNGKMIFEGDKCKKEDGSIGFVRFDYGWCIEFTPTYSHDMPQNYCNHLEVIGNIYEK